MAADWERRQTAELTNIGLTRPPIHLPQTDQNNNEDGDDDDNDDNEDDDNDANYADGHFQVVGQFKTSTVKGPKIHSDGSFRV